MKAQLQRITREIPHRGVAYLIIRRCPAEELGLLLAREVRTLAEQGAREIYVASTDPEAPLTEGVMGAVHFTHIHDMLDMERDLAFDRPRPQGRLRAEPLTEVLGERWLALYNEAFADVPNAATYGPEELSEQLARPGSCGLALEGERPVGIYELDLQTGEIEGIGLEKAARGRGLGRELLLLAMDPAGGARVCPLLASGLYRQPGGLSALSGDRLFHPANALPLVSGGNGREEGP